MKVCGIVAEFNPLHNGHKYLIDQVRQQVKPDFLIVVMSGNYVQRGEVASFDKWQRTQMALEIGADLIVELPFQYSATSVDTFAEGAMQILHELKCNYIAFGTEDAGFDYLDAARSTVDNMESMTEFTDYSKSYATQLNEFLMNEMGLVIDNPNQMLGFNYAMQIVKHDYEMKILPIDRMNVGHDSSHIVNGIASASQIRRELNNGVDVSQLVPVNIKADDMIVSDEQLFELLRYKITMSNATELATIYQMVEGLEYRLKDVIFEVDSIAQLLEKMKSKRYTYARLRRVLLYTLLNVTDAEMQQAHNFIHILGFNAQGREYLKQIKKNVDLPIITKVSKELGDKNGIMALQVKVDSFVSIYTKTDQNFKRNPEMEL